MMAEIAGAKAIPTASSISSGINGTAGNLVHLFLHDIAGHVAFRESVPALVRAGWACAAILLAPASFILAPGYG
jgi:hypothetical protein